MHVKVQLLRPIILKILWGAQMSFQDQFPDRMDEHVSHSFSRFEYQEKSRPPKNVSLLKRMVDFAGAVSVAVLLFPLIVFIAVWIKLGDGGKAIFWQTRIGMDGKEFKCYKFRTMVENADEVLKTLLETDKVAAAEWEKDQKIKNDPRITTVGNILRKTSLDELPQLLNIIRGEMSLVGPRPIVRNEVKKYGQHFDAYSSVLPGVTGLWQVSGRSDTTYDERVLLDVEYAKNQSVWGDLKILVLTVPAVLLKKGAY